MIRRNWIWLTALATAVSFDLLFWNHTPGISFFLFVALCLAGGVITAAASGARPDWKSLLLLPLILATASVTFLRTEPITVFCGYAVTLVLMAVLANTYRGGQWLFQGVLDHLIGFLHLGLDAALHPALFPADKPAEGAATPSAARRLFWPVVRGALLAAPVLLFFAALLASADPVFDKLLRTLFDLDKLPEYLFRMTYVLVGMYLLAGVFVHILRRSGAEDSSAGGKARIEPFIGFVESMVVLGSVTALFAVFVAVQFRYFFGGAENIGVEGFTYSEYTRRGFGELVAVAFFSLLLFLGLGSLTRRATGGQRRAFSGLGVALVGLVLVILASSFQRTLLYEEAYGFTRLRMYTHVFIVWLGVLLVAVAALELAGRIRFFSAAAILFAAGFTLTLGALNVDGAIVRLNAARDPREQPLDIAYLRSLSADAIPDMVELYRRGGAEQDAIGAGLSCRLAEMGSEDSSWQSFRWPVFDGARLLREIGVAEAYPVKTNERSGLSVEVDGALQSCGVARWMD